MTPFDLALTLHKSLAEVESWPARDFDRWCVWFSVRPRFDPWRATAMICSLIANAFRGKRKAATVRDFYPRPAKARKRAGRTMTPEQSAAAFFAAAGGRRGAQGG